MLFIGRFSEDVDITINSNVLEISGESQKIDKIKSICEVVHSQDVIDKYLSIGNLEEEPSEEDSE